MDRRTRQAIVRGITKSRTQLTNEYHHHHHTIWRLGFGEIVLDGNLHKMESEVTLAIWNIGLL